MADLALIVEPPGRGTQGIFWRKRKGELELTISQSLREWAARVYRCSAVQFAAHPPSYRSVHSKFFMLYCLQGCKDKREYVFFLPEMSNTRWHEQQAKGSGGGWVGGGNVYLSCAFPNLTTVSILFLLCQEQFTLAVEKSFHCLTTLKLSSLCLFQISLNFNVNTLSWLHS